MVTPVIKVDISAAMAGLQQIQRNQIPYAASRAINDCADAAVRDLVSWVQKVFNFRGRSAAWTRYKWFHSRWSNKQNLVAYVEGLLDYLLLHEKGGIKLPHKGPHLAVPLGTLRTMRIPKMLRPRFVLGRDLQALLGSASLKGKGSRKKQIAQFGKGFLLQLGSKTFIGMRTTMDVGVAATSPRLRGVRLLYILVPSTRIAPRLRMRESVEGTVQREFAAAFNRRLAEAMRTAR
jgi:hypothetical protein